MLKKKTKLSPVHPGEILFEDYMRPLGMSQTQLAKALNVPASVVREIVHCRRAVTAETAMRLSRYFGQSTELWLGLQMHFDKQIAEDQFAARIRREVKPRE